MLALRLQRGCGYRRGLLKEVCCCWVVYVEIEDVVVKPMMSGREVGRDRKSGPGKRSCWKGESDETVSWVIEAMAMVMVVTAWEAGISSGVSFRRFHTLVDGLCFLFPGYCCREGRRSEER